MTQFKFIKRLSQTQSLVTRGGEHFVASFAQPSSGPEVLVFPATATGEITSFLEVAGGRGYFSVEHFLGEQQ